MEEGARLEPVDDTERGLGDSPHRMPRPYGRYRGQTRKTSDNDQTLPTITQSLATITQATEASDLNPATHDHPQDPSS
jgi:hypothetical protein